MRAVRILLTGDHALVRSGICALLSAIEGVEVIAEAGEGEALRLVAELQPDIMLLDITLPSLSGFDVLSESKKRFPDQRVIVLTVPDAGEYALRTLRAGAAGYLPKNATADELKLAIETVSRGEFYISCAACRNALLESNKRPIEQGHPIASLTPRQQEILTLVAEGLNTKAIGLRLNISVKTVESHRAQLMDRLDIHDVAGLVRYAIKMGLAKVG